MKILERLILPVIVSLLAGAITGWAASNLTVERRLTGLEKDVAYIKEDTTELREDVRSIKSMVFDILKLQKEDN